MLGSFDRGSQPSGAGPSAEKMESADVRQAEAEFFHFQWNTIREQMSNLSREMAAMRQDYEALRSSELRREVREQSELEKISFNQRKDSQELASAVFELKQVVAQERWDRVHGLQALERDVGQQLKGQQEQILEADKELRGRFEHWCVELRATLDKESDERGARLEDLQRGLEKEGQERTAHSEQNALHIEGLEDRISKLQKKVQEELGEDISLTEASEQVDVLENRKHMVERVNDLEDLMFKLAQKVKEDLESHTLQNTEHHKAHFDHLSELTELLAKMPHSPQVGNETEAKAVHAASQWLEESGAVSKLELYQALKPLWDALHVQGQPAQLTKVIRSVSPSAAAQSPTLRARALSATAPVTVPILKQHMLSPMAVQQGIPPKTMQQAAQQAQSPLSNQQVRSPMTIPQVQSPVMMTITPPTSPLAARRSIKQQPGIFGTFQGRSISPVPTQCCSSLSGSVTIPAAVTPSTTASIPAEQVAQVPARRMTEDLPTQSGSQNASVSAPPGVPLITAASDNTLSPGVSITSVPGLGALSPAVPTPTPSATSSTTVVS